MKEEYQVRLTKTGVDPADVSLELLRVGDACDDQYDPYGAAPPVYAKWLNDTWWQPRGQNAMSVAMPTPGVAGVPCRLCVAASRTPRYCNDLILVPFAWRVTLEGFRGGLSWVPGDQIPGLQQYMYIIRAPHETCDSVGVHGNDVNGDYVTSGIGFQNLQNSTHHGCSIPAFAPICASWGALRYTGVSGQGSGLSIPRYDICTRVGIQLALRPSGVVGQTTSAVLRLGVGVDPSHNPFGNDGFEPGGGPVGTQMTSIHSRALFVYESAPLAVPPGTNSERAGVITEWINQENLSVTLCDTKAQILEGPLSQGLMYDTYLDCDDLAVPQSLVVEPVA